MGRSFRNTPARTSGALKIAKRHLYDNVWHVWTEEDQIKWVETVRPIILGQEWGWEGEADIATYIFAAYFRTPRTAANRRQDDWSCGARRRYLRLIARSD